MGFSLRRKIRLFIVLMILVCSLSYMALSFFMMQRAVTLQMQNDGRTLITTIKRELIKNNVTDFNGMQEIFKEIKEVSSGNITYVSLSDSQSKVFLTDDKIIGQSENEVDGVSSATFGGDVEEVIKKEETSGNILAMPDGTKVYNISTDYQYNGETCSLNVGISLLTMYSEIRNSFLDMGIISLIILIIAVGGAIIPSEKLTKPIRMVSANLNQYAQGDFRESLEIKSRDEIGEMSIALNDMRQNLVQLVRGIKESSLHVLDSVKELNHATEESSLSASEISRVSEELTAGAADLADTSQLGLDKMNMLADSINSLYLSMDMVQGTMEHMQNASKQGNMCQRELHEQVNNNGEVISQLKQKVDELEIKLGAILNITAVIKTIADQTNLLAVNARIESARAGEQGRGFGVVAEEIGKLADQTARSIAGIESITTEVEEAFATTVNIMEEGITAVKRTTEASRETGNSFVSIDTAIGDILKQLKLIVDDIREVHTRKEEAVQLIGNISAVAQQSSAATEEITSSLESQNEGLNGIAHSTNELQNISMNLTDLINKFKI